MIRPGDLVYMDVYNVDYLGYKICCYRTFRCGKASQRAIVSPAGQPSVADVPKYATGGGEGSREDRLHLPRERGLAHTGRDLLNGFELAA